jgi:tRNA(Ile)-lysidine synthase
MKTTEQKVLNFIDANSLIRKGDKILVALSGGPDSVFLLYFLKKYQSRLSASIAAFHLNHLLRGNDAAKDEDFCRNLCESLKIPFYSIRKNVKQFSQKNKVSIEEAGRILRYSELNKILKKINFNLIATAHHSNDNAETVLLNLIKGTGLKGISGIPVKRDNVMRPILLLSKDEILKYLLKANVDFRIDSSNLQIDYERNFIRQKLLPLIKKKLNPAVENSLFSSSRNFKSLYSYLLNVTNEALENVCMNDSVLKIPLDSLSGLNDDLLTFSLKEIVERNFSESLTYKDITSLKGLISKQTGRSINLSSGLIAFKERNEVKISRIKNSGKISGISIPVIIGKETNINGFSISINPVGSKQLSLGKEKTREFISADHILKDNFIVRNWKNGDMFYPIGMKGSKKISDFLNELKIESGKKKDQLLLLNGKKIVWVIGHRLDDRFKITKDTKHFLELCLKKN